MGKRDYIESAVAKLITKYKTRDPFELCNALDIRIRYKDCENLLKAYFVSIARIKSIVLNNRVSDVMQRVLVAHELGHAVLHSRLARMHGFQEFEVFDATTPVEYEANLFAAELLIEDEALLTRIKDEETSFFDVASELCIPAELLDFKLCMLKNKGYPVQVPRLSAANFLKNNGNGMYE